MTTGIVIRRLALDELSRVAEIDRTEQVDAVYEQRGTELVEHLGARHAPPWDRDGDGPHSVEAQRQTLEHDVQAGGVALGAISAGRLVGIGLVVPRLRARIAQLAFLHVSAGSRGTGIGGRLCDHLERIAREAGAAEMVVSATPSRTTVHFYLARGFRPMASPLPELVELEPDDIHLAKPL